MLGRLIGQWDLGSEIGLSGFRMGIKPWLIAGRRGCSRPILESNVVHSVLCDCNGLYVPTNVLMCICCYIEGGPRKSSPGQ